MVRFSFGTVVPKSLKSASFAGKGGGNGIDSDHGQPIFRNARYGTREERAYE